MATRASNERRFPNWDELADGGRRYWLDVPGRYGWRATYVKVVDSAETTISVYQEIYDEKGNIVEIHEKFPENKGHRQIGDDE